MRLATVVIALTFLAPLCICSTIYVPDHHATIQGAIMASSTGDTIIVRPGTYLEQINFGGKEIHVLSEFGPEVTAIDGGGTRHVVVFESGETLNSIIEGFTIQNGHGETHSSMYGEVGGGVYCVNSSPTIRNNIIENNYTGGSGGGVYCRTSSAVVENNVFRFNYGGAGSAIEPIYSSCIIRNNEICYNDSFAGSICCSYDTSLIECNKIHHNQSIYNSAAIKVNPYSSTVISMNMMYKNVALNGAAIGVLGPNVDIQMSNNVFFENEAGVSGGAISITDDAVIKIDSCTFVGNKALGSNPTVDGGGAIHCARGDITIENTILWGNYVAAGGKEIHLFMSITPTTLTVSYCDIDGGRNSIFVDPGCNLNWGSGMIDADPLFADLANNDFHLTWDSPCRNAGSNTVVTEPFDFEGDPRIAHGTVDMGADEFYYHLYSVGDVVPGAPIDIKVVGIPGLPALLALGTGIQDPPQSTQHGDLWLKMPLAKSWQLGPIPSTGILTMPATVPSGWPSGSTHPFQALVGPWGGGASRLTNLLELTE